MKEAAISRFLSQLVELANKKRNVLVDADSPLASDLCQLCETPCDDACYKQDHSRWHDRCFACAQCCTPLRDEASTACADSQHNLMCSHCARKRTDVKQGFVYVTQLQQYSFLLRFSLRRLYTLLNVQDTTPARSPPGMLTQDSRAKSFSDGDKAQETINLSDIKRMKSTAQMRRKLTDSHRVAKRSTLMETPSPNAACVAHRSDDPSSIPQVQPTATTPIPRPPSQSYTKATPAAESYYFAELRALDHFMVKHLAVLYLEDLLKDSFSLEELADLIDDKKNSTLWGKFVTSLKAGGNKKSPRTKGNKKKKKKRWPRGGGSLHGRLFYGSLFLCANMYLVCRGNVWCAAGYPSGKERRGIQSRCEPDADQDPCLF